MKTSKVIKIVGFAILSTAIVIVAAPYLGAILATLGFTAVPVIVVGLIIKIIFDLITHIKK